MVRKLLGLLGGANEEGKGSPFLKCVVRGVGGVKASQDGFGQFFPRLPV